MVLGTLQIVLGDFSLVEIQHRRSTIRGDFVTCKAHSQWCTPPNSGAFIGRKSYRIANRSITSIRVPHVSAELKRLREETLVYSDEESGSRGAYLALTGPGWNLIRSDEIATAKAP